jgi:hypothetical protein
MQCTKETGQQGQTMIYKTLHRQLKTNNTMYNRNRTTGANNDIQNITQTTIGRATRNPLKTGDVPK